MSSKFIMFLDCDDTYAKNMCEVMYNTINHFNTDLVMCNYDKLINDKSIIKKGKENLETVPYNPNKDLDIFNYISRWNKIFNKDFVTSNIKCPDYVLAEDVIFSVSAYLNTDKIIYLKNFFGYNYILHESDFYKSITHTVTIDLIQNTIKGLFYAAELIKNKERYEVMPILFENHIRGVLIYFIKLIDNKKIKIKILEDINNFEKYLDINIKFKEKWADILNYFIIKRNFKMAIVFSNFMRFLYNNKIINKIYRKENADKEL